MDRAIKAGVIGHPIAHSKSPLIHGHWIETYGLNGSYEAIDIAPDNLENGIKDLILKGFSGFNVTVPHKEAIMELCDTWDDTVRAIGAVNTVAISENGSLKGYNTDAYGFLANIRAQKRDFDFGEGPALVLGAGGAARAIIYGLLQEGASQIVLTNRTFEKAENLKEDLDSASLTVVPWEEKEDYLAETNLLVNTTVLGMSGSDSLNLNIETLPKSALVTDIVYAPLMTDLLKSADSMGYSYVTGIGMLLHQARPAFEKWYGILPDVTEELESLVLE